MICLQDTSFKGWGTYVRIIKGQFSLGWIAIPINGGIDHNYEPECNDRIPILSETDWKCSSSTSLHGIKC